VYRYARHAALADGCGGANWWALSFSGGGQLIAGVRVGAGGLLAPVLLEARGARVAALVRPSRMTVCNNGWHHYLASVSGSRREAVLFVDGEEVGRAGWGHTGVKPEGLWLGTSEVRISARALRTPTIGPEALSSVSRLALFANAITPAQLPSECLWSPAPAPTPTPSDSVEMMILYPRETPPHIRTARASPQRHTAAGTAAPATADTENTVPQRANPTQTAATPTPTSSSTLPQPWAPAPVRMARTPAWAPLLFWATAPPLNAQPLGRACAACAGQLTPPDARILPPHLRAPLAVLVALLLLLCVPGRKLWVCLRARRCGRTRGYRRLPGWPGGPGGRTAQHCRGGSAEEVEEEGRAAPRWRLLTVPLELGMGGWRIVLR